MADVIIVLIVIILLGLALKGSIKHFKGEGSLAAEAVQEVAGKRKQSF